MDVYLDNAKIKLLKRSAAKKIPDKGNAVAYLIKIGFLEETDLTQNGVFNNCVISEEGRNYLAYLKSSHRNQRLHWIVTWVSLGIAFISLLISICKWQ